MHFLYTIPLLAFIGLAAMIALRTRQLAGLGIKSVAPMQSQTLREKFLKSASMVVFWLFALCVLAYAIDPTSSWVPWPLSHQVHDVFILRVFGAIISVLSVAMYPLALRDMGNSWRIGIDHEGEPARDRPSLELVKSGLFSVSRNPIYVIVNAMFIGAFFVHGQILFLLLAIVYILIVHQEILDEERFLASRFGKEYEEYRARVGRYALGI
jgi:protein-S-isoprenylcysteine O-methyltransferase Ste14